MKIYVATVEALRKNEGQDGLPTIFGDEYSENSEFINANEDDVAN